MTPASVAIVENHATVTAEIETAPAPDPDRPGFCRVRARVIETEAVEGWPNLFERDVGSSVTLYGPNDIAKTFETGANVRFRAKKTGLGVGFVDRYTNEP